MWQSKIVSGSTVTPDWICSQLGKLSFGPVLGSPETVAKALIVGERLQLLAVRLRSVIQPSPIASVIT